MIPFKSETSEMIPVPPDYKAVRWNQYVAVRFVSQMAARAVVNEKLLQNKRFEERSADDAKSSNQPTNAQTTTLTARTAGKLTQKLADSPLINSPSQ